MSVFCESERLYIRNIELSDSRLMAKWKNDPLIREMSIGWDTKITEENQEEDIRRSIERKQLYFIIVIKDTNKPVGYVRIDWLDNEEYFGWLRFGMGEERGKGYAREALREIINKLFEKGAHRIDAEVFSFNNASYNLLLSIGFKHEDTRREAHNINNSFTDIFTLGLLKGDFVK